MNFATEELKSKALEDIPEWDERTSKESREEYEKKLDDMLDAEIIPPDDKSEGTTLDKPNADDEPLVKPDKEVITDPPPPDDIKPDDVIPPVKETETEKLLKAELEESRKFIQDSFGSQDRLKKLEETVSSFQKEVKVPVTPTEKKEYKLRESNLKALKERREALLIKYPDPEDQLNEDYTKELNKIQDGLFEAVAIQEENAATLQAQTLDNAKKSDDYFTERKNDTAKEARLKEELRQKEQAIKFSNDNPQFKLSKSWDDVESDYSDYQLKVCSTYLGRAPKTHAEVRASMDQLSRNSPNLIAKLKISGLPTGLSLDQKKYVAVCEIWDHQQGVRVDPTTGDYRRNSDGDPLPLMRYDPSTGGQVVDTYPSFEAAFADKNNKEGFYTKQVVAAKIKAGKDAIDAINKRDSGASELGATETTGGTLQAKTEALKKIETIDENELMYRARNGDPSLLNEYNALARTLEWSEMEDPLA